jgi:hypothetical protein
MDAVWVGIAMLALQSKMRASGKELSPEALFDIASYAIRDRPPLHASKSLKELYPDSAALPSPEEVKKDLEKITRQAIVLRNSAPLSSFN